MFEALRAKFGYDIGLVHDIHERPAPNQSIELCRAVQQCRPFYMEDPVSPEDVGWFQIFRQETSAPLAMGELFVNRNEWLSLVANRWIDFIRIHQSAVGGLNMCRKVAHCCEFFDVRTAWHGPNNVDPVGHCYNLHLDLVTPNFGIQKRRSSMTRHAKSSTARRRFAKAICTPTINLDSASISMRKLRRNILIKRTLRAGAMTVSASVVSRK